MKESRLRGNSTTIQSFAVYLALAVIFALVGGLSALSYARFQHEAGTTASNLAEIIRIGIEQTLNRSEGDIRSFVHFLQPEDLAPRQDPRRRYAIEKLMGNQLRLFPQTYMANATQLERPERAAASSIFRSRCRRCATATATLLGR